MNLHISSETNTQGVASASSPNEWVAHAHDAVRGQEAKARDDEAARVAEFEKLLWEQRTALEAAIASGDQVLICLEFRPSNFFASMIVAG